MLKTHILKRTKPKLQETTIFLLLFAFIFITGCMAVGTTGRLVDCNSVQIGPGEANFRNLTLEQFERLTELKKEALKISFVDGIDRSEAVILAEKYWLEHGTPYDKDDILITDGDEFWVISSGQESKYSLACYDEIVLDQQHCKVELYINKKSGLITDPDSLMTLTENNFGLAVNEDDIKRANTEKFSGETKKARFFSN